MIQIKSNILIQETIKANKEELIHNIKLKYEAFMNPNNCNIASLLKKNINSVFHSDGT